MAAADIRRPDDNKLWAVKTDMSIIDRLLGAGLLEIKQGKCPLIVDKATYTAVEAADSSYNGFYTIVLATVKAGAWRASWAMNFCAHLNALVPMCRVIFFGGRVGDFFLRGGIVNTSWW